MSMDYAGTGLPVIMRTSLGNGYLKLELLGKHLTVHRLVAEAFLGRCPSGAQVNHINGVKTDNRVSNLEYVTRSENMKHAFRLGLQSNQGERHSQSRLTDEKVREIRQLLAVGFKQAEVAKMMNVHQTAVSRANSGKRWGHVSNVAGDEQAKNQLVAV
jgi:HNH endonuclease